MRRSRLVPALFLLTSAAIPLAAVSRYEVRVGETPEKGVVSEVTVGEALIAFRGARITVISATNTTLQYKVMSGIR